MIFSGDNWNVGDGFDELEFSNLVDDDRPLEFAQKILTFDYFDGMAYISSPQPTIIFKYDQKAKKYYPANRQFASLTLKVVEEEIEEIRKYNESNYN